MTTGIFMATSLCRTQEPVLVEATNGNNITNLN